MNKLPKKGDLVVATVKKIMPYGAFLTLDEYPGIEGFLHISEVASKWIKSITQYLKVGERTVVKVLNVEEGKTVVDVSLRRVKEDEKRKKLEEFMNIKRSIKLIQAALKKAKSKKRLDKILKAIDELYETPYDFVLYLKDEGVGIAEEVGIPKKVGKILYEMVVSAFKPKKAVVKGKVSISIIEPNGIEILKKAFEGIEASYLGGGHYLIRVEKDDYKTANKEMRKIFDSIKTFLSSYNAEVSCEVVE